uniref:RING-type domain-containing protein n=1 Tax=Zooxanthella nutricula TaxID=1333877 RepID=A0A7S2QLY4_9DINO
MQCSEDARSSGHFQEMAKPAEFWDHALEVAKQRNLTARAGCVFHAGGTCQLCGGRAAGAVTHASCEHAACVPCWTRHLEAQLLEGARDGARCWAAGCERDLPWAMVTNLCSRYSQALACHAAARDPAFRHDEGVRHRRAAPAGVEVKVLQHCVVCTEPSYTLLTNRTCGHAVCEGCWRQWVDAQAPECLAQFRAGVRCLSPGCERAVQGALWEHLCGVSGAAGDLDAAVRSAQARLQVFSAAWAVPQWRAGPECPICREPCWALVRNECGHAACERCWPDWAASQVERLLEARRPRARCFAPACRAPVSDAVWGLCCEVSQHVQAFHDAPEVTRRRQLEANPFYPRPLQVDCPLPGCWGLGYLGFDRVMCFVCEHQWDPEEGGAPPEDLDVQEVMGCKVKQCPNCKEYIEKNGGCDHMTCKCRHEFHWSTLKPYRG